jgi:histidinol phosphatase-like PHP family hydrolase
MKRIDLHTHSLLSDGELVPTELARRAESLGHAAIAITDHVDRSNIEWVTKSIVKAAAELNRYMDIRVIPGVELTHVPVATIPKLAKLARKLGAEIVLVHGETMVEPVKPSTNDAALACPEVDILAHPGVLTTEQADQARGAGIYLELTSRQGHCLANGWIARVASESKAELLVNTDAHTPDELLTLEAALNVAKGAGLGERAAKKAVVKNPEEILQGL